MFDIAYAQEISNRTGDVVTKPDVITQVLTQPWIYLVIVAAILGIIYLKSKDKKQRPEEKPFFGWLLYKEMTHKAFAELVKVWGVKTNLKLYKGFGNKYGKIMKLVPIIKIREVKKDIKKPQKKEPDVVEEKVAEAMEIQDATIEQKKKENKIKDFGKFTKEKQEINEYLIAFRNFGLIAWLKYYILNRYEIMFIPPSIVTIDNERKILFVEPKSNIISYAGVWTLAGSLEIGMIDEMNTIIDISNIRGFSMDFLRRLSSEAPSHAMAANLLTHQAELKEAERRAKTGSVKQGY